MAELLVRAKGHYMDSWTPGKVNGLSVKETVRYNSRAQARDIIVIQPNGWEWGKMEGLPNYYIIKVPNLSVEDAELFGRVLYEDDEGEVMLKQHRFSIPQGFINQAKQNGGVVTINVNDNFTNSIVDKR